MSNIIDKIKLSGVTYTLSAQTAGGSPTVELTQAEYDALVSAGTVSADTYYIITDAQAGDLTQYWTSAQTQSAINQATSGKVNTSSVVSSVTSASTDSEIPTAKAVFDAIPTGGTGGGKAIEAGRGISVTTGETADTVSFNLPISAGTGSDSLVFCRYGAATGQYSTAFGNGSNAQANYAFAIGNANNANGPSSFAGGNGLTSAIGSGSFAFGFNARTRGTNSVALGGYFLRTENDSEIALGIANVSNTGSTNADNTLFSVGNGTADNARHNAFEIRQNGDIYISSGGTDIKLQDNLGGITIDPSLDSGSTNAVANSAITIAIDAKQDTLSAGTNITIVDNVISAQLEGGAVSRGDVEDMISAATSGLVSTSAITSAVTSASTDSEIPTAKAVYDATQGGGSITIDPSLDSGSTNAVANSAITEAFNGTTYGSPSTLNNSFVSSRTAYVIIYDVPNVEYPTIWFMRCYDSSVPAYTSIGIKDNDNFYDSQSQIMTDIPNWIDQELSYYDSTTRKRYVFLKNGVYADYFSNVNGYTFTIFETNNTGLIGSLLSKHSIDTDAHTTSAEKSVWNAKLDSSAITTSISSSSTDSQVPSAKAVYDIVGNIETLLSQI